ncbi:MAG: hypothetical protein ACI8XV_003423, partial [Arenicella sp.]
NKYRHEDGSTAEQPLLCHSIPERITPHSMTLA